MRQGSRNRASLKTLHLRRRASYAAPVSIYGELAPHYDALFPVGEAQSRFLASRLAAAKRVLDAGCGTGRHLELLRDWGHAPTGLEPDPGMAALARRRLGGEVEVFELGLERAAALTLEPFDAVLCLGNTLAHLLGSADLDAACAAFHALLRPGGLLITQTVNYDRVLTENSAGFPVKRIASANGELCFTRDYDFSEAPRRLGFQLGLRGPGLDLSETLPLRPWLEGEQRRALSRAGMGSIEALGDWDGSPWSAHCPATLLVATRPAD